MQFLNKYLWKNLNFTHIFSIQKTSRIFNTGFPLSKWHHLHRLMCWGSPSLYSFSQSNKVKRAYFWTLISFKKENECLLSKTVLRRYAHQRANKRNWPCSYIKLIAILPDFDHTNEGLKMTKLLQFCEEPINPLSGSQSDSWKFDCLKPFSLPPFPSTFPAIFPS